jgi:CRP-like cAMP-binding protein
MPDIVIVFGQTALMRVKLLSARESPVSLVSVKMPLSSPSPVETPRAVTPLAARGIAVLGSQGWLSRGSAEFREAVLARAIWRTAEPGDVIASEGDDIGGLIGIAEGALAISAPGWSAAPVIHIFQPGDWTGQVPLITGKPRRATTVARMPALYALVTHADMVRLLAHNPGWWRELAQQAEDQGELATLAAINLMVPDSVSRTAGTLLRLAGYRPPKWPEVRGDVILSHDELATIAGISRNTLSKILREFETAGLLETSYRRIRLLDAQGLKALTERPDSD